MSQVVATIVGRMVAAGVLAHEKTVYSALNHCLVVVNQRVKRSERDGLENGAPGRTRTRNPLIRSQVLYPIELRVHQMCPNNSIAPHTNYKSPSRKARSGLFEQLPTVTKTHYTDLAMLCQGVKRGHKVGWGLTVEAYVILWMSWVARMSPSCY
jgi:hypothetical protein